MPESVFRHVSAAFHATASSVLALLQERLQLDACLLSLKDGDDYVVLDVVDGAQALTRGPYGRWEDSLCHVMARRSGVETTSDVLEDPEYAAVVARTGLPVRAYAGVALRGRDGSLLGSICALSSRPRPVGSVPDEGLMVVLGQALGDLLERELAAVRGRRAVELATGLAHTDDLTGLLNRRGWDAALAAAEDVCAGADRAASVFVLDLDDLKSVNDLDGHAAGDALLRRAADALADVARVVGRAGHLVPHVGRTGGDEFCVLVEGCDALAGADVAVALVGAVRDAGVAASLGYAVRHPARGLGLAVHDADELMRADKRRRRGSRASAAHLPVPRTAVDGPVAVRPGSGGLDEVESLLRRVRGLFGLETAFVSRLADGQQTFTHLDTDGPFPVVVGDQRPLSITLCQRVLDGDLPPVITDATQHEASRDVDVVRAGLVRTYLTVPVHLPDGELYGTLCCLSSRSRPDLTADAAAALSFAAHEVGTLLEGHLVRDEARRLVSARIDRLLDDGDLRIALQPVVDLDADRPVGFEALARFADGRGPDAWFAEAAAHGEGERLELAALEAALAEPDPQDGTFLAVNLSGAVLTSPAFQERLRLLAVSAPRRLGTLVVELTEHERITDYTALAAALAPWRRLGLRLSIDDTGAGHSSLTHVLKLRPDVIKLDRQMITALDRDPVRRGLVHRLQQFCHDAQIELIAEGVETEAEAAALRAVEVRFAQGFHLGRPLVRTAGAATA